MSIKRVSDLQKRSLDSDSRDDFQSVLDDTYNGGTAFSKSLMEISWNKNPSNVNGGGASGDDNEFESQAITINALSAGITDALYNRDVTLKGNKTIKGDVNLTGNVNVNKDVDLNVYKYKVDINGYDINFHAKNDIVLCAEHDTIISSHHHTIIKGETSVIIEIDNPDPRDPTAITFTDKDLIMLSSGNQLSIIGKDVHLVYDDSLTIWHRLTDGSMKPMLQFDGDEVYARGNWHFPESYPSGAKTIDGYISHAYYS